jgi:protein O-GlcNAc transferase
MSADRQLQKAIQAHQRGELAAARELYRQVLRAKPREAIAMANLAVIAIAERDYDLAENYLRRALAIQRSDASIYSNLGVVLRAQGRLDEAIAMYQRALVLKPDYADARLNLGNALKDGGRIDEAISAYERAIRLRPRHSESYKNLGNALREQGKLEEATAAYRRAIELDAGNADAYNNLGATLRDRGQVGEAVAAYRKSIELKPDNPDALSNLGITLRDQNLLGDAVAAHRRAIALKPDNAAAHNNLGVALSAQGELEPAAEAYRRAIELKPDYAEAWNNLGNVLQDCGRLEEAIAAYRSAVECNPDYPEAFGQFVHQRQHACDWTDFDAGQERLLELVRHGKSAVPPFLLLASAASAADQLLCARKWAAGLRSKVQGAFDHPRRTAGGKIRLGYLSADFHQHATAYLMAELFERHDRAQFDLIGYSYGPDDGSEMRARLVRAFDRMVDVRSMPHEEAARRIHDDRVDVLVDLKGYTMHARTEILALRPAPVQVSYLGFPGTTGAEFIDCLIADRFIVPAQAQPFYSERVEYLPDCYQPNDTRRAIAERTPTRSECLLPDAGFVFCCFNNSYKIAPAIFDVWMRLLAAVPGSVLWLLEANAPARGNLRREAGARGVDPARLVFAPRKPLAEHLARHRQADLFLDTLPCNAHTTASDALWAGLPVLTCAGETFASRVAGSLLQAVGLPELVTASLRQYEALALALAREPRRLDELKEKLARQRLSAPLFDIAALTRNLEAAYVRIWARHCSGSGN